MSILTALGVYLVNGILEVGIFFLREISLLILLVCALVFTRWEIADHREISSGIRPEEVAL